MLIPFSDKVDVIDKGTIRQARQLGDSVIVLKDNARIDPPDVHLADEVISVSNKLRWDDWGNRMTLLSRAMAHDCDFCIWMDADMTFAADVTRERLDQVTAALAESEGHTAATVKICEMWNETQYRNDGWWRNKIQRRIIKNPLTIPQVRWSDSHRNRLHFFPHIKGYEKPTDIKMLHWGMYTPRLRMQRYKKYVEVEDPGQKFQKYDYMLKEKGIELVSVPVAKA